MPLDDLVLTPSQPAPPSPEADVKVMTRVLRLPTTSLRQARSMVRLQLDRISPLPVSETLHDVVPLTLQAGQGDYAIGVIRRRELMTPPFECQPSLSLTREVEGRPVTFRFRNPSAVGSRERSLLAAAPWLFLAALGVCAFALSLNLKTSEWRDVRLPQVAAEDRALNQAARAGVAQVQARADWTALDRSDAATALLCLSTGLAGADAPPRIQELRAQGDVLLITFAETADAQRTARRLNQPVPSGPQLRVEGGCG